jgi:hypothetical protein
MKRVAILALLFVLGLLSTVPAQGQTIYVADPGVSFGPMRLGQMAPFIGWTISCTYNEFETKTLYYPRYGLSVTVPTTDQEASLLKVSTESIAWVEVEVDQTIFPSNYSGGCATNDGRKVTADRSFPTPPGIVYLTNKGARLGMSVGDVIAAHGIPVQSSNYQGNKQVASLDYCGLTLKFDSNGRLSRISVGQNRCK